jgi:hypothetical protein
MHKWTTMIFFVIVLLLIVTHAPGFAESVTAVGGQSAKGGGTGVLGAINTLSGAATAQQVK